VEAGQDIEKDDAGQGSQDEMNKSDCQIRILEDLPTNDMEMKVARTEVQQPLA
jgi:hypothetical protein